MNATIQMRRGNYANLDPMKLKPGEWAVSLDQKYVHMCFGSGIVRRMATYEAFEEDMKQIQTILVTCQDIQTAVEAFEALASQKASAASASAKEAQSYARGGTGTRTEEDTDNAKYYAHQAMEATQVISTLQSGTSPLTDSADGNVCGLHLVGKSYKSKNLLKPTLQTTTLNGITCTDNGDGTYTVDGTASGQVLFWVGEIPSDKDVRICGCPKKGRRDTYSLYVEKTYQNDVGDGINVSAYGMVRRAGILIQNGVKVNSLLFKPMLVNAGLYPNVTYDDYEPYGIIKPSGDIKTHNSDSTKTSIVHTDHPLLSVGDIKNELIINPDGSGIFTERVKSINLGDLSWDRTTSYANPIFYQNINDRKVSVCGGISDGLNHVNDAIVGDFASASSNYDFCFGSISGNKQIFIRCDDVATTGDFKTWLSNNGVKLIYELATPTTTELSASEVADLLSLQTFQGGTYFDADGAEFTVTYFADTNVGQAMADVNTKLHTFYDELRTAIVALNGTE